MEFCFDSCLNHVLRPVLNPVLIYVVNPVLDPVLPALHPVLHPAPPCTQFASQVDQITNFKDVLILCIVLMDLLFKMYPDSYSDSSKTTFK